MRNTLLLKADSIAADAWRWLQLGPEGRPQGGIHSGALLSAAAAASGLRVVVLVSGAECLLTSVRIPGRNRQKLLRAVPYALEETLSDDVENLHFAVGERTLDGQWPVAVISRQYMETLLAVVTEAKLDVQQVVPELLAIPLRDGEFSVLVSQDVALVRTGSMSGYAVDCDNLGLLLAAHPQEEDQPLPAVRMYVHQDSEQPNTTDYAGEVRVEPVTRDPLGIFALGLEAKAINLLQGAFSKSGEWSRLWRPWRVTAALLLAGVLVSNVVMGVDYYRLNRESEQLLIQIEDTFRKAMPGTKRIVNPRVQMQQQLDQLQRGNGGGDFLQLLGKTGSVLKEVPDVEIGGMTYRGGRLDLDIKVASLQLLDTIKQSLGSVDGLKVGIQSATTGKDQRVQSRLRIERTGS
jgi:general secretion pathway protein L